MTQRIPLDDMTSDQLDQLYDELDRAREECRNWAEAESADIAAGSYAGRVEELEAALREVLATLYAITRLNDPTPLGYQAIHPILPADYQRWTAILGPPVCTCGIPEGDSWAQKLVRNDWIRDDTCPLKQDQPDA